MVSYLYLLCSSACSLVLVHLLKLGESKDLRMLNTLTANYVVAAAFSFLFGSFPKVGGTAGIPWALILFTAAVGAVFIGNFLAYSRSIHRNGMGISVAAMRLSLLVPVLVSILMYGEQLTAVKVTGLLLVFAALALLLPRRQKIRFAANDSAWLLLVVFLLTGFADASLKIYREELNLQMDELGFMGLVFLFAAIIGWAISLNKKGPVITRRELGIGTLIGIPNLYSSVFLIYALGGIDGSEAYPAVNILNVVGGTLLGLWYWKDRVTTWQWIGIGLAAIAIVLLTHGLSG